MALQGKDSRLKNNLIVRERLRKLFEAAQEQSGHQDLVEKCKKLFSKCVDEEMFLAEFLTILRYCLVYPAKVAVDRMLSFVARVVISLYNIETKEYEDDDSDLNTEVHTLSKGVLEFLFRSHGASLVDARIRCVQLLSKILTGMPENSAITDDLWMKLSEAVLCRIQDKSPLVRVQAVLTARKLQNPKNNQCEIIKALQFHLNDPSAEVRRTIVSSIALNKVTIGYILARTRDVNDNVRRNVYVVFSKVRILNLTIKYRVTVLERGLQDRSDLVRKCVEQLVVVHWLESFDGDILKFLEALDVVGCPDVAILVLQSIFKLKSLEEIIKCLPIDEQTQLIPSEKLTPESVLLWRCLAHYLVKEQRDEELETIIPNLTVFCDYIRCFYPLEEKGDYNLTPDEQWTEVKEKQILKHLLELAKVYDLSDEMGRTSLKKLIISMLTSPRIANNMVECLVQLMVPVIPGADNLLQELAEVISEVREPLNTVVNEFPPQQKIDLELQVSNLKTKLNELREEEYEAVQNKDYAGAQNLKNNIDKTRAELEELTSQSQQCITSYEVREEKNDPDTMCKCLSILVHMVKCSDVRTLTSTLRSLKENFLNQCLASQDLMTQSLSLQALGQFCILDKDLAKENLIRFSLMLSETGDNEVNIPALHAIFDIIHMYGMQSFEQLDKFLDESIAGSASKSRRNLDIELEEDHVIEDKLEQSRSGSKYISFLEEFINCKTNDTLKTTAYEGLCKLLLSGYVYSTSLLTKIVVSGFSPVTESESEDFIRQVFMVFFPMFATSTPRSQAMIESAFVPVMRILMYASFGTPEADINPKDVATFLIEHTKPDINKFTSKTLHIHNNLALSILHELVKDVWGYNELNMTHIYLKTLLQLEISHESEAFPRQLLTLIDRIAKELPEKQNIRLLAEFRKKIEEKNQVSIRTVDNTLITTDNTTRGTVNDETFTTGPTRGSSIRSSISSVASVKKRRTAMESQLSTLAESLEDSTLSDSSDKTCTLGPEESQQLGVVPESPEISEQSIELPTPSTRPSFRRSARNVTPMVTRSSRKRSVRSIKKV